MVIRDQTGIEDGSLNLFEKIKIINKKGANSETVLILIRKILRFSVKIGS